MKARCIFSKASDITMSWSAPTTLSKSASSGLASELFLTITIVADLEFLFTVWVVFKVHYLNLGNDIRMDIKDQILEIPSK